MQHIVNLETVQKCMFTMVYGCFIYETTRKAYTTHIFTIYVFHITPAKKKISTFGFHK